MSKILLEEINENESYKLHEKQKLFFNGKTKIYPIDYVYCESYIKQQLSNEQTETLDHFDTSNK